jgi:hypothetical protein
MKIFKTYNMNVQIFIQEENKQLIYDNDQLDEFKSLVSELGLQCDNHIDKEKSPIPFMWLDESTIRAFNLLCPRVDKLKDFRLEIPLEILRNVKLAQTEQYFDWIEIWSNTKDPDPFCIGRVYKTEESRLKSYTWTAETYLIGRWGAENKSINELIDSAVQIASQRIEVYTESCIAKLNSWKSCPTLWAKQYIFNNNSEAAHAFKDNSSVSLPF